MSVESMAAVLNHSRAVGTDKVVLIGIANHDGDGGAWPTVATLARYANTTERTVQRSLGNLVKLGEVAIERQAGGLAHLKSTERPNRYLVLVRCPHECDGTVNHRLRKIARPTQSALALPGLPESDPVTHTSPGDAHVTPPGDADVTHNHPHNPTPIASEIPLTKPRARAAAPEVREAAIAEARERMAKRKRTA